MRLTGWEDKRFDLPPQFEPLLAGGEGATFSTSWSEPLLGQPNAEHYRCRRMSAAFPSDRAFWRRVWAMRVLSRAERAALRALRAPEHELLEWLAGRTAAKEAVLDLLRAHAGLDLRPADVEIELDESGCLRAGGIWAGILDGTVIVSVSRVGDDAVALVGLAPATETGPGPTERSGATGYARA
jgi:phosphopantetheinyl transferase (holo-ACP synthase)